MSATRSSKLVGIHLIVARLDVYDEEFAEITRCLYLIANCLLIEFLAAPGDLFTAEMWMWHR